MKYLAQFHMQWNSLASQVPYCPDTFTKFRKMRDPMQEITEHNILLRQSIELPKGLQLATEEFRDGWDLAPAIDAKRMEEQIQAHGWNFIRAGVGALRSGVGETSQESIASALKMSLRRIPATYNSIEVDHIELTEYPWFFLARVRVNPYCLQQGAELPIADEQLPGATTPRHRRLPIDSNVLYPYFGSAMPRLKEMLVTARKNDQQQ